MDNIIKDCPALMNDTFCISGKTNGTVCEKIKSCYIKELIKRLEECKK